jgi:hypothetical protein
MFFREIPPVLNGIDANQCHGYRIVGKSSEFSQTGSAVMSAIESLTTFSGWSAVINAGMV